MREQDYRAVTRHVTNACSNVPLTEVAGRLTVEECLAAAQLIGNTPEAEERADDLPVGTEGSRHVNAPHGLFPSPLLEATQTQVLAHFKFVGRLVGKALLDQRHLDLPLSPAMLKVMVGHKLSFQVSKSVATLPCVFACIMYHHEYSYIIIYIYIYMYILICTFIYMYVHVYIYVCIYIYIYIYIHIHIHIYVHTHVCLFLPASVAFVRGCVYVYSWVCVRS